VLDVQMPGLSGLDLQLLLAREQPQVPIIFLTGHGDIPTSVRAIKTGALEFLTKPFDDEQLLTAIRQAIAQSPTALAEARGRVSGPSGATAKLSPPALTLESEVRPLGINSSQQGIAAGVCATCGKSITHPGPDGECVRCLVSFGFLAEDDEVERRGERNKVRLGPLRYAHFEIEVNPDGYPVILGSGAMAVTYRARDTVLNSTVALKVISRKLAEDPIARARFLREARAAAQIHHPNIARVTHYGEQDGECFYAMELVHGETLEERVQRNGPLPLSVALEVVEQTARGLAAGEECGVIHRDLKPSNLMIESHASDQLLVKIIDYGVAKVIATQDATFRTQAGFIGTPAFASPEQFDEAGQQQIDTRSDIYAVGVTLYYLLTGTTPFKADNVVRLLAIVLERPAESPQKLRAEIPEELAKVTLRCLAKLPSQRFTNYEELRQALFPFTSAAPTPAGLGIRFVAGALDHTILGLTGMVMSLLILQQNLATLSDPASLRSPTVRLLTFGVFVLGICFYALPEGRWGASPGKAICRLRVVGPELKAPGVPYRCALKELDLPFIPGSQAFKGNGPVLLAQPPQYPQLPSETPRTFTPVTAAFDHVRRDGAPEEVHDRGDRATAAPHSGDRARSHRHDLRRQRAHLVAGLVTAIARARSNTASIIGAVRRPVKVFC
jgi:tRNA A-37 threonylcarbamoyl transferase component Bud32